MSQQNLMRFFEALARDDSLRAKFEAIGAKHSHQNPDESLRDAVWQNEILPLAQSEGFELTLEDLKAFQVPERTEPEKLSDDELDSVAGGGTCVCFYLGFGTRGHGDSRCTCFNSGSGSNDDGGPRCNCNLYGVGF